MGTNGLALSPVGIDARGKFNYANVEVIEFCDPRINTIKQTIEEVFDVTIDSHSLHFYGKKNKKK